MKTIGRVDRVDFPEFGLENVAVKIDTGANRSSIHCSNIEHVLIDGKDCIKFEIPLGEGDGIFYSHEYFKKDIKSSSGHVENRYVVRTDIVIFGMKIHSTFSLTDRTEMKYPILLGRKLLKSKFLVDVAQENLSFKNKNK